MAGLGGFGAAFAENLAKPAPPPDPSATPEAGFWEKLNPATWKAMLAPYWTEEDKAAALPEARVAATGLERVAGGPSAPNTAPSVPTDPEYTSPFWQQAGPILRATGNPAGNLIPQRGESGDFLPLGPPATPAERAEMLAQFSGNALPMRGGLAYGEGTIRANKAAGTPKMTQRGWTWAEGSDKQARIAPEAILMGVTDPKEPNVLKDVLFRAAQKVGEKGLTGGFYPDKGAELISLSVDKWRRAYAEFQQALAKLGITIGEFKPAAGQAFGVGADVEPEVRKRAFQIISGSKAEPYPAGGEHTYRMPLRPRAPTPKNATEVSK